MVMVVARLTMTPRASAQHIGCRSQIRRNDPARSGRVKLKLLKVAQESGWKSPVWYALSSRLIAQGEAQR